MVVIIPHPTEELKLIKLQKALIAQLNSDDGKTVWYAQVPLFIPVKLQKNDDEGGFGDGDGFGDGGGKLTDNLNLKEFSKQIETITLGEFCFSDDKTCVFLPVTVKTKKEVLKTELPLIHKLCGTTADNFTAAFDSVKKLKVPVPAAFRQCKIAQMLEQVQDSQQKLHNSCTTVQSSKTSSYIFQNSVWFKQSK